MSRFKYYAPRFYAPINQWCLMTLYSGSICTYAIFKTDYGNDSKKRSIVTMEETTVSIFTNPTNTNTTVEFDTVNSGFIIVLSIDGKEHLKTPFEFSRGVNDNSEALPTGAYIIEVNTGKN